MNSLFLIGVVFMASAVYGNTVKFTDAQLEKAKQHTTECVKETGVKPELVTAMRNGTFTEDDALKKFTLCFFKKAGIVDSEGKTNIDVALSKLPPGADKAAASKLLEKCQSKMGKDAAETVYERFKCYREGRVELGLY